MYLKYCTISIRVSRIMPIFFDTGFNFFKDLSDFLRFFENAKFPDLDRIDRNGTVVLEFGNFVVGTSRFGSSLVIM